MKYIFLLVVCSSIHASQQSPQESSYGDARMICAGGQEDYFCVSRDLEVKSPIDLLLEEGNFDRIKSFLRGNTDVCIAEIIDKKNILCRPDILKICLSFANNTDELLDCWDKVVGRKGLFDAIDCTVNFFDDVNIANSFNTITPTMVAAYHHSAYGLQRLFDRSDDICMNKDACTVRINRKDRYGNTALHHVFNDKEHEGFSMRMRDTVQLLLDRKASPLVRNNVGLTPLALALRHKEMSEEHSDVSVVHDIHQMVRNAYNKEREEVKEEV